MREYVLRHLQLVFFTRLRARTGVLAILIYPDYFLIGLRGPLRVRALVLVR